MQRLHPAAFGGQHQYTKDAWQQETLYIHGTALRLERILTPLRTQTLHSLREHTHKSCKCMPSTHPINTNYNLQFK